MMSRPRPNVRRGLLRFALWALVLAGGGAAAGDLQEGPLRALLPDTGSVPGWAREGAPLECEGEELYGYIDGGAEIYREFGFRRVIVQDYKNARGKSVSLEVFEMESPAAAFGMFTFKRSGKGEVLELGGGAELEDYYMNFWKGRFLVTLTGFDETAETMEGMRALARAVDSRLRDAGESAVPALVSALPEWGLSKRSVKYFKGLLGLNNIYLFQTARGLGFVDGVQAVYEKDATLIVLEYGTNASLVGARDALGAYIKASIRFETIGGGWPEVLLVRDEKEQYLFLDFDISGTRLHIGVSTDKDAALAVVRRASHGAT